MVCVVVCMMCVWYILYVCDVYVACMVCMWCGVYVCWVCVWYVWCICCVCKYVVCVVCSVFDVCAEDVCVCVCYVQCGVCTYPKMPLQFRIAPAHNMIPQQCLIQPLLSCASPSPLLLHTTLRPPVGTAPHCSETIPSSPQLSGEMPVIRLIWD